MESGLRMLAHRYRNEDDRGAGLLALLQHLRNDRSFVVSRQSAEAGQPVPSHVQPAPHVEARLRILAGLKKQVILQT